MLGITYKDDSTLERLRKRGLSNALRLDPERDLGVASPLAGLETFQASLQPSRARQLADRLGRFDVVVVRHILEHAYDPRAFVAGLLELVTPEGILMFEVPDCERGLLRGDWTTPWEEHVSYFTHDSLARSLGELGLESRAIVRYPYPNEDSFVAFASPRANGVTEAAPSSASPANPGLLDSYAGALEPARRHWRERFEHVRASGRSIAIFGAGHASVTFVHVLGLVDLVDCFLDDSPHKRGLVVPGTSARIVGSSELYERDIGLCLLAIRPDAQATVRAKHAAFSERGGQWDSIYPTHALSGQASP